MSNSVLFRKTTESSLYRKTTTSPLYRKTADFTRRHSRASVITASVAAVGVLGAAGFAASAPWEQGDSPTASGQPGAPLSQAIAHVKAHDGKPLAVGQLDAIHSAALAGGTGAKANIDHGSAAQQAVTAAQQKAAQQKAAEQKAAQQKAARQKAAAQQKAAQQKAAQQKAAQQKAAQKAKAHAQPYTVYDSVQPGTIPSGKDGAVYVNGSYAASPQQLGGLHSVLWIDTNGSDPAANALDVEPGDATPAVAAQWVQQRLSSQPNSVAIVYTMRSEWQQVKDNVAALPGWMQSKVRYWIADPTGFPHVVPGSSATQWYWGANYDVTTANPDFAQ
jgi:hypothetical protein